VTLPNGSLVKISIKEEEEPADVIFRAAQKHGLSLDNRRQIMNEAKRDGVKYTREFALILAQEIALDDGSFSGILNFYDDGREPVDALHGILQENDIEHHFNQVAKTLLPKICTLLLCQRMEPIIWAQKLANEKGDVIGTLEIIKNVEPVDVIDHFAQAYGLDVAYRNNILRLVCDKIVCTRTIPVVFKQNVVDGSGNMLGSVQILEGEEVVDAVSRFIRENDADGIDHIGLKNHFFQQACDIPRLLCTRNVAILFSRQVTKDDGSIIGQLVVKEYEEPADVIFDWCNEHNLDENYLFSAIEVVCSLGEIKCNRQAPLITSIPLNDPEGNFVGNYEVQLRQEPADALYQFFAKHGLFAKKWNMQAVLEQVCGLKAVHCNRRKAIKYYEQNYTMGGVIVGSLVIWEDEEVVDTLYAKRKQYNLTLDDQMRSFIEICMQDDILCERTKAVIYKMTDITYYDFEIFGNETCKRRYAGWQFLASFSSSSIGSKIVKFVQKEMVVSVIEHPLIGVSVLWISLMCLNICLGLFSMRKKVCSLQKIILYVALIIYVSCVHVYLIEPIDGIDSAMHMHEGKLPDLTIFEEEEPADAVLKWAKEAARKHHPIVRKPIHLEILEKVCNDTRHLTCTRTRAWESIDMGSITLYGQSFNIEYFNPDVDPNAQKKCVTIMEGKADTCIKSAAIAVCRRIHPQPPGCVHDITLHMSNQLIEYEKKRLDSKDTYKKLGMEMDAPGRELFEKLGSIVRSRGMNLSPFSRVDNGTEIYPKWDEHTLEAWAARDTFYKIRDPESREWNDKPCEPVFGGALCAKTDKDGNMQIEV